MADQQPSSSTGVPPSRDYYERDVDFNDLAKCDPDFAKLSRNARATGWFDFQDPKVVQQLTTSLLKRDFNLHVALPDDRLCPPVPVRWNYVRWIQDLLDTSNDEFTEHFDPEREVLGLDVGVGASCIYALLACQTRRGWRVAGTEIDAESLECARRNVVANGLQGRIKLREVERGAPVLRVVEGLGEVDFVMTNPPFYESREDFESARKSGGEGRSAAEAAVTMGTENEMICEGGDVGFVTRILEESLRLREKVQWYTAMLSKLASLQQIVAKIKESGITNWAVTSLHPGNKTKRYAVAWSFQDLRPRNDVARHGELVMSVLPPVTANTIKVPMQSAKWAGKSIDETMKELDNVDWSWKPLLDAGVMQCKENVWSRAARRKKKFGPPSEGVENLTVKEREESDEDEAVGLAVKVTCKEEQVDVRWLRGNDQLLFESFCGMLKRALTSPKK